VQSQLDMGLVSRIRTTLLIANLILVLSATSRLAVVSHAYPYNPLPHQPGFENGLVLPGAAVDYASPTMADLNGDGLLEILIGGRDGKVYAVRHDGSLMWQFDGAAALNAVAPARSRWSWP
jgi:outer membrane protein assembly factor BamB